MSKVIKINLELTLQNPKEVSDLISMLQPFAGAKAEVEQPKEEAALPANQKPARKRRTKAEKAAKATEAEAKEEPKEDPKPEAKEEPKEDPKPETKEETPTEENSDEVTIDAIRALLAKKVGDHRAAIKAKLTELEAKNVTNLDKAKYGDFYSFLNTL